MNAQKIIDIINSTKEKWAGLDVAARKRELLPLLESPISGSDQDQARVSWAYVTWVASQFHHDLTDGLNILTRAERFFVAAGEQNQKLRYLIRDLDVHRGNLFHFHLRYEDAIQCYERALKGERDPDRRMLGGLNVARSRLAMGKPNLALIDLEKFGKLEVSSERLRQHFTLFRARILLTLGCTNLSQLHLQSPLLEQPENSRIHLERDYLKMWSGWENLGTLRHRELESAYAPVCALALQMSPAAQAFYDLECRLLALFLDPDHISNKRTFQTTAKGLARKSQTEIYYELVREGLVDLSRKDDEQESGELPRILLSLTGAGHWFVFSALCIGYLQSLLKRRRYQEASRLWSEAMMLHQYPTGHLPHQLAQAIAQQATPRVKELRGLGDKIPERWHPNALDSSYLLVTG